jgi:protein arginine kinase
VSWYIEKGPESDVILSSRIRLARNLNTYPFPNRITPDSSEQVAKEIIQALRSYAEKKTTKYLELTMNELSDEEKQSLVEKHLVSEDLTGGLICRLAVIRQDEAVSVMINEEDHIRIQAMEAGLNLEHAYETAKEIACYLEQALPIAYHDQYGFLTACPSNTGTGMRASVIMHLPGIVLAGKTSSLIERIQKMGYSVRGYYGEHSSSQGNMFQISNQITLGLEEEELIGDLKKLIGQVIEQERAIRKDIYGKSPVLIEDMVYRSLGMMKYARILTSEEALKMISDIRLGTSLGILKNIKETHINRLMSLIGPASVQKSAGRVMGSKERDMERAEVIRKELKDGDEK